MLEIITNFVNFYENLVIITMLGANKFLYLNKRYKKKIKLFLLKLDYGYFIIMQIFVIL